MQQKKKKKKLEIASTEIRNLVPEGAIIFIGIQAKEMYVI